MLHRFDLMVTAQQTRRVASATGGAIRGSTLEELGGRVQRRASHCGAVAGESSHGPMT